MIRLLEFLLNKLTYVLPTKLHFMYFQAFVQETQKPHPFKQSSDATYTTIPHEKQDKG